MPAGGHPNSLGRTVEVVERLLEDRGGLDELLACYRSPDPVVRLRASRAVKRVAAVRREWLLPYVDRLIDDVVALDQPSARWTLAQVFLRLTADLTPEQRERARALLRQNLASGTDWIVLITTMDTLASWAEDEDDLRSWLRPHLVRLGGGPRRSVANKARSLQRHAAD